MEEPFCCEPSVQLLRNARKTERGAGQFLVHLVVRAAPLALLNGTRRASKISEGENEAIAADSGRS
jgi:hypothetical protein